METSFILLLTIFFVHSVGVYLLRKTQRKYTLVEDGVLVWSSRSPAWVFHLEHVHRALIVVLAVTASMPLWKVFLY